MLQRLKILSLDWRAALYSTRVLSQAQCLR